MVGGGGTKTLVKTRYYFIDNLKIASCILVVLGHFFMSMTASDIMPVSSVYNIVMQAVYTFHVPLFFVCSGFLYQKSNRVHGFKPYLKNISNKLLNLGVPYFTFTIATYVIKLFFEDSVTTQNADFFQTLFVNPSAPYWYLYALFIFFLIIPCVNSKKQAWILFAVSVVFKIIYNICYIKMFVPPYIITSILGRMIWFAGGMLLSFYMDKVSSMRFFRPFSFALIAAGTVLSVAFFRQTSNSEVIKTVIGILFTAGSVFASVAFEIPKTRNLSKKLTPYFMPVFLMHTIFAAGVRIVLIHLGMDNIFMHLILGIPAGFLIPAAVYKVCEKLPVFMFFIYPQKAIDCMKKKRKIKK